MHLPSVMTMAPYWTYRQWQYKKMRHAYTIMVNPWFIHDHSYRFLIVDWHGSIIAVTSNMAVAQKYVQMLRR